jgi:hypothetical protein
MRMFGELPGQLGFARRFGGFESTHGTAGARCAMSSLSVAATRSDTLARSLRATAGGKVLITWLLKSLGKAPGMVGARSAWMHLVDLASLPAAAHPFGRRRLDVTPQLLPARGLHVLSAGVVVRHA